MYEMTNTTGRNRKRTRGHPQIIGKAWVFHALITTDADLLHTESDNNEEGPFPNLQPLLLAHWTSVLQHLDAKIKKPILHFVFFFSLTSLLSRTPDPKDLSKVQIRIRAFLQFEKIAVTVLVKLLLASPAFLSGSWERC